MNVLTINNLSLRYDKTSDYVLKNISLSVPEGAIFSLVGESGSGKSSLLRSIAGLEQPEQGEIVVNGNVVLSDKLFVKPEKRNIGLVFQDYALFPHMTVAQNIAYGIPKKIKAKSRMAEVLELVKMTGYEKRYPHELSGGEQQRIGLARALAPKPNVLLLDEPFSNLDETLKDRVREEICSIIKADGTTAILVTHDTRDAMATSDQIAILRKGELEQIADPVSIYKQPANPYVARFFGKVNILELRKEGEKLLSTAGDCSAFKPKLPPNFSGQIVIRPEDFILAEDGLKGRVERVVFQGSDYELTVACGKEKLLVNVPNGVKVGTQVALALRPAISGGTEEMGGLA